jgi:hypothetical protein
VKRYDKIRTAFVIAAALFLGLTYLPLLANERILDAFAREDGIFENLTAIYLLATSVLFAVGFFYFRKSSWWLRLSYLGLALLFFVGAGEEISWGERIFDWDDHNFIRGINVQKELNIHNLKYFQGEDAILPLNTSQLLLVFAFGFPLACRLFPRIEKFLTPIFPVVPFSLGLLSVATYVYQKAVLRILPRFPELYQHPSMPIPQGVHEIREHGFTFALLASVFFYFWKERAAKEAELDREIPANLAGSISGIPLNAESAADEA